MKIQLLRMEDLGRNERARWRALQAANPTLASPCFSWDFAEAVDAVHDDVFVAVLEEDGVIVGFFPFQRRLGAGRPLGGRMSDHHGVVAAPGTHWHWGELLLRARLSYWQFDHLPAWQCPPVMVRHAASPGLDLSGGFEPWLQRKLAAGQSMRKLQRAMRKLERELGPLKLDLHSHDDHAFATVLRLKSEQCLRTGEADLFATAWKRELVERIRAIDREDFGGRLSTLHAGDTLLAAHFGMHTPQVWHWWFPVYNREFAPLSPGLVMLVETARAAAGEGHRLLDLGKGDEPYKSQMADTAMPLVEGLAARPTALTAARHLRKRVGAWLRTSRWARPALPLLQRLRGLAGWVVFVPDLQPLALFA
ncbi:GNAT family N-acetyltransferase [Ramlibacter humi]|uniref:GNAT family N-acetyltransferase n=1 Tax=Ramlibacter humi TaxID=2530451 RepID=A0A4Z0BMW3_9BURK|nr:GNAT family N-acetyltransferase [Ramlibacter humi]TFZ00181.1 GNAT family N-acetyltransferase [Ramlibacter humi]